MLLLEALLDFSKSENQASTCRWSAFSSAIASVRWDETFLRVLAMTEIPLIAAAEGGIPP